MKKYEKFLVILPLLLILLCGKTVLAEESPFEAYTPEQLTQLAHDWLSETLLPDLAADTELQVTALDPRLGSKFCDNALAFSLPSHINPRQTTVQISCDSPASWQLFLPVRITEWLSLVVMRQNIAPGTVLTVDMVEIQRRERRLVRGAIIQQPEQIIGSKAKRSLSLGQIITLQDLCLVCRGDIVTIEISNSGLFVSASGMVQQDGSLGDMVTVKNQQSGRNIQAEVTGVNQVQVKF